MLTISEEPFSLRPLLIIIVGGVVISILLLSIPFLILS